MGNILQRFTWLRPLLIGIGAFGFLYFSVNMGLSAGNNLASRLSPPFEPLADGILIAIKVLPYAMSIFSFCFAWYMEGKRSKER